MGFFDAIGDIINPKNVATGLGFALGGPAGAAIGRGAAGATFGNDWVPFGGDQGFSLGEGIQGGMEGAALGFGGQALGLGAGGGAATPQATAGAGMETGLSFDPTAAAKVVSGGGGGAGVGAGMAGGGGAGVGMSPVAAGDAGGGGGMFSKALSDLNSYEKLMLGSQAVGAAGNIYGAIERGQIEDERQRRSRRMSDTLAPYVRDMMEGIY